MLKNILIWIAAMSLSVVSGTTALGAIAKNISPDLALSLHPKNGFAAEKVVSRQIKELISGATGEFPDRVNSGLRALAIEAFEAEPSTPEAVAIIALANTGDVRRALMQKAFALSRRQQLVTGWMIMDGGERRDIPAVLKFYDVTLRTNASSADVIIPVLVNALANENFVVPFATVLSQSPPWAQRFWGQVVVTPETIGNAASLRRFLYAPNERDGTFRDAALISALANSYEFEKAEMLYALLSRTKKNNDLVRDGEFQSDPKYPPIDWQLFSNGEYGASIYQGRLNLSAIRNSGGLVARQLVMLPNKIMMLETKITEDVPLGSKVFLRLSCAENIARKPNDIRIPFTKRLIRKRISNIDGLCHYYWLDIIGRFADDSDGFDVAIESISLRSE